MTLAGNGLVGSWNDVVLAGRDNMYQWHNRQHMPERVGIPGFIRGRRFIARRGSPEFFILYEAESLDVLGGADYLARLNDPTPWTKASQKNFFNSYRAVWRVPLSIGVGLGGFLLVIRFEEEAGNDLEQILVSEVLPPIEPEVGIAGVHLGIPDRQISAIDTIEKHGRVPFKMPGWIILVEAVSEEVLDRVLAKHFPVGLLESKGARGPTEVGIYQMEFCCWK